MLASFHFCNYDTEAQMKNEIITPLAKDTIEGMMRRAEENNPGMVAAEIRREGPAFVVELLTEAEALDLKCQCGRHRRDCDHPIGWEDGSQARHALSNRDLGITDGSGRSVRW